jgi:type IV secretory pathway component VirB8
MIWQNYLKFIRKKNLFIQKLKISTKYSVNIKQIHIENNTGRIFFFLGDSIIDCNKKQDISWEF